jgi:hypothetical protein
MSRHILSYRPPIRLGRHPGRWGLAAVDQGRLGGVHCTRCADSSRPSRSPIIAITTRSALRTKLSFCNPPLKLLPDHFKDVTSELLELVQNEHPVVRPRHLARRRRVAAGAAGDTMGARGLNGLGEGHRRQDGGEPPGQHGLARPRRADEEQARPARLANPIA